MPKKFLPLFVFALALFLVVQPAHAIALGQIDDFQDGGVAGWSNGGFATPVTNIANGGPLGAGDRYIQLTADGGGAGGRLTTFNFQQWIGNYIAAGVNTISIDLINQSAVSLSIRLAFQQDNIMGSPGYLSQALVLAPGSGWQHFSISLAPGSLIAVDGPSNYTTFFTNFNAQVRIINEVGTSNLNGDPVVGQLGIDNIRAIPEPTVMALVFAAAALFGARLWRVKRHASGI